MKTYTLKAPLTFTGGLLGLSKEQAGARAEHLEEQKPGVYLVTGKVMFKAGEVISIDAPKAYLKNLEEVKPTKKK